MKTALRFVLALSLQLSAFSFFTGCASTSTTSPATPADVQARRALAVEAALSIGLVPVLQNNPDYIPAAQAVAATLDTITKDTLTPEDITAFIAAAPVKEKDRPTVSAIVVGAWLAYSAVDPNATGVPVQPAVKPFLNAAARGLRSAASAAIANPKR